MFLKKIFFTKNTLLIFTLVMMVVLFFPKILHAQTSSGIDDLSNATTSLDDTSLPIDSSSDNLSGDDVVADTSGDNDNNIDTTSSSGGGFWAWFANLFSSSGTTKDTTSLDTTVDSVSFTDSSSMVTDSIEIERRSSPSITTNTQRVPVTIDCYKIVDITRAVIPTNETRDQKLQRLLAGSQAQECQKWIETKEAKNITAPFPIIGGMEESVSGTEEVLPVSETVVEDIPVEQPVDNGGFFEPLLDFLGL